MEGSGIPPPGFVRDACGTGALAVHQSINIIYQIGICCKFAVIEMPELNAAGDIVCCM